MQTKWNAAQMQTEIALIRAFAACALLDAEITLDVHTLACLEQYRWMRVERQLADGTLALRRLVFMGKGRTRKRCELQVAVGGHVYSSEIQLADTRRR
jgi:hypothetical protein